MIKLRFLMAWQNFREGAVIEPMSAVQRSMFLALRDRCGQRVCEIVEEVAAPVQPLVTVDSTETKPGPKLVEAGPTRKHHKRVNP